MARYDWHSLARALSLDLIGPSIWLTLGIDPFLLPELRAAARKCIEELEPLRKATMEADRDNYIGPMLRRSRFEAALREVGADSSVLTLQRLETIAWELRTRSIRNPRRAPMVAGVSALGVAPKENPTLWPRARTQKSGCRAYQPAPTRDARPARLRRAERPEGTIELGPETSGERNGGCRILPNAQLRRRPGSGGHEAHLGRGS